MRWAVSGLLLWLLVGPRVELPLGALRVEDLVFVALGLVCLLHVQRFGRPSGVTLAVAGVAAAGVVSALVASGRGMVDPLSASLYAVRPAEYWIVFPATLLLLRGTSTAWSRRLEVVLAITTVLQTAFAVLQYYFDIPIGFSHAAYTRAAGLTVGPYELGAMSAALAVFWVHRGRWVLASLSVVALAASISRVSVLAATVALTILSAAWVVRALRRGVRDGYRAMLPGRGRSRLSVAVQIAAVMGAGLVLAFTFGIVQLPAQPGPGASSAAGRTHDASEAPAATPAPEPTEDTSATTDVPVEDGGVAPPSETVTTRIADTSLLGSWRATGPVAAAVPHLSTSDEYREIAYGHIHDYLVASSAAASGGEASNLVRFFRWHLILDTFDDPVDVVFGLGPSFVGPSVDGSYLRFFADGGLLGVVAWLVLIVMWLRRVPLWTVCVTIALLIGALFIDIVYAQRPMVLFWIMLAMATSTRPTMRVAAARTPKTEDEAPTARADRPLARV